MLHELPVRDLIQWGQKDFAEEYRPASAGGGRGRAAGAGARAPTWAMRIRRPWATSSTMMSTRVMRPSDDVDTSYADEIITDASMMRPRCQRERCGGPMMSPSDADAPASNEDEIIMDTLGTPARLSAV